MARLSFLKLFVSCLLLGKSPHNQWCHFKSLHLSFLSYLSLIAFWVENHPQRSWGLGKQGSLDSAPPIPHPRFAHLPLFIPPLQMKGAHEEETESQNNWEVCVERRGRRTAVLLGLMMVGGIYGLIAFQPWGFCLKIKAHRNSFSPSYCLHESLHIWRAAAETKEWVSKGV